MNTSVMNVSDVSSHGPAQLANFADFLRNSDQLRSVLKAIYKGKKQPKSAEEIQEMSGLKTIQRVLNLIQKLESKGLIRRARKNNHTYCYKIPSVISSFPKIIRMAESSRKLEAYNKKIRGWGTSKQEVVVRFPKGAVLRASQITIDAIDSFTKVNSVDDREGNEISTMLEKTFKNGIRKILNENWQQNDWGGEGDDLYTTRVRLKGKRIPTAFAFKGRATKPPLTPKKMGKNGDQIQRLFKSPARLYVIQFHGSVDPSVIHQMQTHARMESHYSGNRIYFMVINGQDSARLVKAYPKAFK